MKALPLPGSRNFLFVLTLALGISWGGGTRAEPFPTPPVFDWTTDGVSVSDQAPWPSNAVPQLLGHWTFDSPTQLNGFRCDPPMLVSNLFLTPSPWGSALQLSPDSPAYLRLGVRQANTNGDFSVRNGTVSLWLRPNWSPGSAHAPLTSVPLVEVGTNSLSRLGWWAWVISPGGGEMQFLGQARGQQVTSLRALVPFASNRWIHLALTWTPTNSSLFANGVLLTNGAGATHWPAAAERNSLGWGVGGDRSGLLRVSGDLDRLVTANYPLSPAQIQQQVESAVQSQNLSPNDGSATAMAAGSAGLNAPTLPDSFRPGLWIESGLDPSTRVPGGWLRGTTPGIQYEIFAAPSLEGLWSLDQSLPGATGQTWTPFTLKRPTELPWFVLAASYADTDQDGLSDEYEKRVSRTSISSPDSDGDSMPDGWEVQYGLNPLANDILGDLDGDGFCNGMEQIYQQDPSRPDVYPLISARTSATGPIREGVSTGKFILKRSGSTAKALEVQVAWSGPTANGLDYAELPERVSFAVGRSEVELVVNPLVDGRDEKDEAVILTVKRGIFYGLDAVRSAQIVIQDSDLPAVSITAADSEAREPEFGRTDLGKLEVVRSGLTDLPLVIQLRVATGSTAVAGTDYLALPSSLTIPAGEIRATMSVIPLNNKKLTGPKLLKVEIGPSPTTYTIPTANAPALVTIADCELPVVSVTATLPLAEEKLLKSGQFKFTRLGGTAKPLNVFYVVGGTAVAGPNDYSVGTADYEALPEFVVIPAGSAEVLVPIKPIADSGKEPLESIEITLLGSLEYLIGEANSATVHIDDSNVASWKSRLIRPASVAGLNGPEGLIEIARFGTVLTDMTIPFKVSGQRILKPSGWVYEFGDPKLTGLPASYLLSYTGGRLGGTPGTFLLPKGLVTMTVGLKANLPSDEVKGATLVLSPGAANQEQQPVHFLDRWHLVTLTPSTDNVVEAGQMTVKITAAAADPAGASGTTVRLNMVGTADFSTDVSVTGASSMGVDEDGTSFVDVSIPAKPAVAGTTRSATVTIKAVADGRVEKGAETLVMVFNPRQISSALTTLQVSKPYAPLQIRDTSTSPLPPLDSDSDALPDSYELDHDLDPLTPSLTLRDEDRDGLLDSAELKRGTRYDDSDSDEDGVSDFIESLLGSDPLKADAGLAVNIRDYVPIRLQTEGALREKADVTCFHCHAPGMLFGGIEQMPEASSDLGAPVARLRNLLLAPGTTHEVTLSAPPNYAPNLTRFKSYSAEILPANSDGPTGFIVLENDLKKPLLGKALPIDSDTFAKRKATLKVLPRPLLAVDANRDGTIQFDPSDATSADRRYRFWVNNDHDSSGGLSNPGTDFADGIIQNLADLEDFSRLWVDLQGIESLLVGSGIQLAFEWRKVTEGAPSIQIYPSYEIDGGLDYLRDPVLARHQVKADTTASAFTTAIPQAGSTVKTIRPGERYVLPATTWAGSASKRHLLFEAGSAGIGQLVLLVLNNGKIVSESPPLHLELRDIKEMYYATEATPPEGFLQPYKVATPPVYPEIGVQPLDPTRAVRPDATWSHQSLVFVHGWNMEEEESVSFAETLYKRLWHVGYRGKLHLFRWPTDALISPEVLDFEFFNSYNFSEHRAFVYGKALKQAVAALPPGDEVFLLAHSMGGIVASSALYGGMNANAVLFMQSAVPASVFDTRTALNNDRLVSAEAQAPTGQKTPDLFQSQAGYRGYLLAPAPRLINYYNANDFALMTGTFIKGLVEGNWMQNHIHSKPHWPDHNRSQGYIWYSRTVNGISQSAAYLAKRLGFYQILRWASDDPEVLAFVARSRTRALGAEPGVQGTFTTADFRNLSPMGIGDERPDHSGQFLKSAAETYAIYLKMFSDLQ